MQNNNQSAFHWSRLNINAFLLQQQSIFRIYSICTWNGIINGNSCAFYIFFKNDHWLIITECEYDFFFVLYELDKVRKEF